MPECALWSAEVAYYVLLCCISFLVAQAQTSQSSLLRRVLPPEGSTQCRTDQVHLSSPLEIVEVILSGKPLNEVFWDLIHLVVDKEIFILNPRHIKINEIVTQKKSIDLLAPWHETVAKRVCGFHCHQRLNECE
jgi:hypothetical protein